MAESLKALDPNRPIREADYLRSKRTIRRSKRVDPDGDRRGQIKDLVSISQRPAAVEDRAVPSHWEGDLLAGSKNSYIVTLVERHTRYVMLAKVTNKDTHSVVSADVAARPGLVVDDDEAVEGGAELLSRPARAQVSRAAGGTGSDGT